MPHRAGSGTGSKPSGTALISVTVAVTSAPGRARKPGALESASRRKAVEPRVLVRLEGPLFHVRVDVDVPALKAAPDV